ncbi:MAG: 2-hydroxymuconate tautomerase family protein [bacterium]|nr:2-hydroxymuconate tautomerase family protein [bacterium]MDE0290643.1 2-hydroxymuconate tautomerase family protein [bacterium]MDE0439095.1 2-hydroxymuconate tautomerase family protein [bacterium]
MPIITVNLLEGRSAENIEKMITQVSEAAASSLDAPIETVRVMVNEMPAHTFGIGGRPASVVMAERRAAASATSDGKTEAREEPG